MIHLLSAPPAAEPVTLASMRAYLGISDATTTDRDTIITARIATARQIVEQYTRRALITQTWHGVADAFSLGMPLISPLQSVAFVHYTDSNGTEQTVNSLDYYVRTAWNEIRPAYGKSWPEVRESAQPIVIEYDCGYGDTADDVPLPIVEAIMLIVATWERFQSSIEGMVGYPPDMPNAVKSLLNPFIDYRDIKRAD